MESTPQVLDGNGGWRIRRLTASGTITDYAGRKLRVVNVSVVHRKDRMVRTGLLLFRFVDPIVGNYYPPCN